jgi:DNA modification methylase
MDASGSSHCSAAFAPLYDKDGVLLYCGDNCETMLRMPAESVDLVVTSPPYDDLRTYGGHSWDFYGVAWNLKRLLKPGGVIVWVVGDATKDGSETGSSFLQAMHFKSIGLRLHDTMIYQKANAVPLTHNRYEQQHEYMFVLSNGTPRVFNGLRDVCVNAGRQNPSGTFRHDGTETKPANTPKAVSQSKIRYNVWPYSVGFMKSTKDVVAFEHPASFPEALARDHILSWSNESDTVLDPFSGSGTTIKMARETGRRGIGIEINEEYCQIAIERLRQRLLFGGMDAANCEHETVKQDAG